MFGGGPEEKLKILDESIEVLSFAIFIYLFKKYIPIFGKDKANLWAVGIINTFTLRPPGNEEAKVFYEKHAAEIFEETATISQDTELSGPSGGVSYLYAAEILYSTAMTKSPQIDNETKSIYLDRIQALEEQAVHMGIWIPDSYQICGCNDVTKCISRIHAFANNFLNKHK